jgi:hypothetical protein
MRTQLLITLMAIAATSPLGLAAGTDSAPTDEQLMQPTAHGIRLTPEMARAFSAAWLGENLGEHVTLTEDEQVKLSGAAAKRYMNLSRMHEREGAELIEFAIENLLASKGKFTAEMSTEFARRAMPHIPWAREFIEGVRDDAGKLLPPAKAAQVRERLTRPLRALGAFDAMMQRWSQGQFKEGDRPFIDSIEQADKALGDQKSPQAAPQTPAMRRAQRVAGYQIRQIGPPSWREFLNGARRLFGFDAEQAAKAEKLLADYTAKAEAIMTPAWKSKLRQNRIRNSFQYTIPSDALGPWLFHLEKEYNELQQPVQDLEADFRQHVLGLATDQQRASVLTKVQEAAAGLGLTERIDAAALGLPAN